MQNFVFASLLRPVPDSLKKKYEEAAEDRELQVESSEGEEQSNRESGVKETDKLTETSSIVLLSYSRKLSLEEETDKSEHDTVYGTISNDSKEEASTDVENIMLQENTQETVKNSTDKNEEVIPCSPLHLLKQEPSDDHSTPRNSLNEVEKLALTQKSTFAVLCDYAFIIYFINNILWNMGVVIILLFGPQYFLSVALDEQTAATVFSIGGFGAFAGSILGGLLGNIKTLRLDMVYIVMTVITGTVCLLFPIPAFHSFEGLTCLYVIFSVVANIIMGLLVVAVAAIVGPEALGTGMGFVMLANGIGSVAAPPLIGK